MLGSKYSLLVTLAAGLGDKGATVFKLFTQSIFLYFLHHSVTREGGGKFGFIGSHEGETKHQTRCRMVSNKQQV